MMRRPISALVPSLASGPSGSDVADRVAGDVRLERLAERKALVIFDAERPGLGAGAHPDGGERKDDEKTEADVAELPENFARAGGLKGVDEEQHAGDGADDGKRTDRGLSLALGSGIQRRAV